MTKCDVKNKKAEILMLEKENKRKDEVIKNLNAQYHKKVAELKTKVEDLETFEKETLKSEKRALKKQKQKAGKEAAKNNFEHVAETYKDANDNFAAMLDTKTDLVTAPAEK